MERVRVTIFTEDSGKGASEVVQLVSEKLLRAVQESPADVLPVKFEQAKGPIVKATRGNAWNTRRKTELRRRLVNRLSTLLDTGHWLIWHVDADRPWPRGKDSSSEELNIVRRLRAFLEEVERTRLSVRTTRSGEPPRSSAPARDRVLLLVPWYSIESWLYLAEPVMRERAPTHSEFAQALNWLRRERKECTGLDHVAKVKDACPLGARHNLTLARRWSLRRAAEWSPSVRHTRDTWKANQALVSLLAANGEAD